MVKPVARPNKERIIPPQLDRSKTLLPTLSTKNVAIKIKNVFIHPTAIVASSMSLSLVMPVEGIMN